VTSESFTKVEARKGTELRPPSVVKKDQRILRELGNEYKLDTGKKAVAERAV